MAKPWSFSATPVSEGVRLEVKQYTVFAVRNEDKDISIRVRREPRTLLNVCMRIPLLRGVVRLFRSVIRFFDGLDESAELKPQHPVRGTSPEQAIAAFLHIRPQTVVTLTSALLIPVIAVACLYAAPAGLELLLENRFALSRTWLNVTVTAWRIVCLLTAVGLTGRLRVFRRLLMYKGAMNQVLNCHESHQKVNVHHAAEQSIFYRRSDAAFLIGVLCFSYMFFPLLHPHVLPLAVLFRVLIVLVVAALLNEPISLLEEAEPWLLVRILRTPIDLLQHMTTLEPHPQMLEVAVCAFKAAMGKAASKPETEVNPDDHRGMDAERD